jgi:hypothetical protein
MFHSNSNFDSNIQLRCCTLIIAKEYVAFEMYSISILIPTPIPIANPSFHVIVIISARTKTVFFINRISNL